MVLIMCIQDVDICRYLLWKIMYDIWYSDAEFRRFLRLKQRLLLTHELELVLKALSCAFKDEMACSVRVIATDIILVK